MKSFYYIATAALTVAVIASPIPSAASYGANTATGAITEHDVPAPIAAQTYELAKKGRSGDDNSGKGRGRGRGGDRDDDHRSKKNDDRGRDKTKNRNRIKTDDDNRPSGRSRPRIPGGSGCDDAGDILEHAECRG